MGDTGSLALGGALGTVAVLIKREFLLVVVGGVFVAEALSVMIQVLSFKLYQASASSAWRRCTITSSSSGWTESRVVTRFYIVGRAARAHLAVHAQAAMIGAHDLMTPTRDPAFPLPPDRRATAHRGLDGPPRARRRARALRARGREGARGAWHRRDRDRHAQRGRARGQGRRRAPGRARGPGREARHRQGRRDAARGHRHRGHEPGRAADRAAVGRCGRARRSGRGRDRAGVPAVARAVGRASRARTARARRRRSRARCSAPRATTRGCAATSASPPPRRR